jgi:hypothetical protein
VLRCNVNVKSLANTKKVRTDLGNSEEIRCPRRSWTTAILLSPQLGPMSWAGDFSFASGSVHGEAQRQISMWMDPRGLRAENSTARAYGIHGEASQDGSRIQFSKPGSRAGLAQGSSTARGKATKPRKPLSVYIKEIKFLPGNFFLLLKCMFETF